MSDDKPEGKNDFLNDEYLSRLQRLNGAVESKDTDEVNRLVGELTTLRESSLFQELGKLTREIHESINTFSQDDRVAELAELEIPDAKERLNYIVEKTNEAAHKTMNGAEDTMSVVGNFSDHAKMIKSRWDQFRNRELSKEEFVSLSEDIDHFMVTIPEETQKINQSMTEIMLAQDYQDLTGQMIKQVITMVKEVEEKLVRLVAISGATLKDPEDRPKDGTLAHGPQLPNSDDKDIANNQDDVDDLLASLGF